MKHTTKNGSPIEGETKVSVLLLSTFYRVTKRTSVPAAFSNLQAIKDGKSALERQLPSGGIQKEQFGYHSHFLPRTLVGIVPSIYIL